MALLSEDILKPAQLIVDGLLLWAIVDGAWIVFNTLDLGGLAALINGLLDTIEAQLLPSIIELVLFLWLS